MSASSIHIERFDAVYMLPADRAGDAAAVQRRFDEIARRLLSASIADAVPERSVGEEPIIFIERMEVVTELELDDEDDREVARAWGTGLARSVARVVAEALDGVTIFNTRAEYLAGYIQAVVRGSGADRWYFAELREHGGRIIDLLTADGDTGRDALIELARRGDLELLLTILDDEAAERLVAACLAPPGPRLEFPRSRRAWLRALCAITSMFGAPSTTRDRDLARLYLTMLLKFPELGPDVNLARFVGEMLDLRDLMQASGRTAEVLRAILADDVESAVMLLVGSAAYGARGRAARAAASGAPTAEAAARLLRELTREVPAREVVDAMHALGAESSVPVRTLATRFGGLFLLAPTLEQLGVPGSLNALEGEEGALLLLGLLLQCVGAESAPDAIGDGAVALLAGYGGKDAPGDLNRYCISRDHSSLEIIRNFAFNMLEQHAGHFMSVPAGTYVDAFRLTREQSASMLGAAIDDMLAGVSAAVMQRFAFRLGAFADSTPGYLRRNFIESRALVEISDEHIMVRMLNSPLQMILRMAGFESTSLVLSWLGGRRLEFQFDS